MAGGDIIAIRVQDIARQIWYNYDNGRWDRNPEVSPGTNTLYIAAYAINTNSTATTIRIEIKNALTVLAWKSLNIAPGGSISVEYTGNMPAIDFGITIAATP